jgi:hypothetical protein
MPDSDQQMEQTVRETAYFIWEREGRPDGRAQEHWGRALVETSTNKRQHDEEPMEDEEKILAGRPDANMPALLTQDVPGG